MLTTLAGSSQTSPTYWLNPKTGVSYPVSVQTPQRDIGTMSGLQNIPVTSGTATARSCSAVFRRRADPTSAVASHYNVRPVIDIYATPQARDLGGVAADIRKVMQDTAHDVPKGASVAVRGQVTTMTTRTSNSLSASPLRRPDLSADRRQFSVLARSVRDRHGAANALAGIVWILFATGTTLSVPALTGAIMCMALPPRTAFC